MGTSADFGAANSLAHICSMQWLCAYVSETGRLRCGCHVWGHATAESQNVCRTPALRKQIAIAYAELAVRTRNKVELEATKQGYLLIRKSTTSGVERRSAV